MTKSATKSINPKKRQKLNQKERRKANKQLKDYVRTDGFEDMDFEDFAEDKR